MSCRKCINEGLCPDPVVKEGRARWYPPCQQQLQSQLVSSSMNNEEEGRGGERGETNVLRVHNSLTDAMDVFVPRVNQTVTMYVCGPTVYDACHMGHARAYLTFDILRRILEGYLNYNVIYQVNITDIDDKIILRARQNKLIADYTETAVASKNVEEVKSYIENAMQEMKQKLTCKVEHLEQQLAEETKNNCNSKLMEKHAEALKEAQFKLEQFQEMESNVTALLQQQQQSQTDENGGHNHSQERIASWISAARDALANKLDAELGHSVTDPKVFEDHARYFEREFHVDMAALGVQTPDVVTRVTEYVPQCIEYITKIIQNQYAYEANGSVYFDTNAFKANDYDYRKLKPGVEVSAEEMAEGEGALTINNNSSATASVTSEKKHPNDFALWKASKAGEPSWESPWGPGRPGWHIECSVMASDIFGHNIDIHGGGVDLMFPHHDNEMAQAEAYHECAQWVNYFLHAGHLHIKGLKMSKSLKNFITIRQALEVHTPRQLRFLFLLQPWDKPMNYSDQTVDDAKTKERYFKNFFGAVKSLLRQDFVSSVQGWTEADRMLSQALLKTQESVHNSLLDNFKTYEAIQALVEIVQECNKYMSSTSQPPKHLLVKKVALYVTKILRVFGVVEGCDEIGFGDTSAAGGAASKETILAPYMDAFTEFRDKVRLIARTKGEMSSLLSHCDDVRDNVLAGLGVRVEDSTESSVWKLDDPGIIRKEIEEKRQKAAEAAAKKKLAKIERLETELAKWKDAVTPPSEMFKSDSKWGSFDETGKPLTNQEGEPLPKSQQKNIAKDYKNQEKAHEKLLKAAGEQGIAAFLVSLEKEISELKLT